MNGIHQQHDWGTYKNPRNGRLKVTGCRRCGVIKSVNSLNLDCIGSKNNVLESSGWIRVERIAMQTHS